MFATVKIDEQDWILIYVWNINDRISLQNISLWASLIQLLSVWQNNLVLMLMLMHKLLRGGLLLQLFTGDTSLTFLETVQTRWLFITSLQIVKRNKALCFRMFSEDSTVHFHVKYCSYWHQTISNGDKSLKEKAVGFLLAEDSWWSYFLIHNWYHHEFDAVNVNSIIISLKNI